MSLPNKAGRPVQSRRATSLYSDEKENIKSTVFILHGFLSPLHAPSRKTFLTAAAADRGSTEESEARRFSQSGPAEPRQDAGDAAARGKRVRGEPKNRGGAEDSGGRPRRERPQHPGRLKEGGSRPQAEEPAPLIPGRRPQHPARGQRVRVRWGAQPHLSFPPGPRASGLTTTASAAHCASAPLPTSRLACLKGRNYTSLRTSRAAALGVGSRGACWEL